MGQVVFIVGSMEFHQFFMEFAVIIFLFFISFVFMPGVELVCETWDFACENKEFEHLMEDTFSFVL
jgi:hypothetical protein